jgi:hypothetical protein
MAGESGEWYCALFSEVVIQGITQIEVEFLPTNDSTKRDPNSTLSTALYLNMEVVLKASTIISRGFYIIVDEVKLLATRSP